MSEDYVGITLNQYLDTGNWASRENTVFKDIIDLLGIGPDYAGTNGSPRVFDLIMGVTGAGDPASIALGVAANVAPRCPLDVVLGDCGAAVPVATAGLSVENSAGIDIQMLCPANQRARILFGDADDNDIGAIRYNHVVNELQFVASTAQMASINSTGLGVGVDIAASYLIDMRGTDAVCFLYQSAAAGTVEPLRIDQEDNDLGLIRFDTDGLGGGDVTFSNNYVGAVNTGAILVNIDGTEYRLRVYTNDAP